MHRLQYCHDSNACREYNQRHSVGPIKSRMVNRPGVGPIIPMQMRVALVQQRYLNHKVGGIQHDRLVRLIYWARDHGVKLALLQLPNHQTYLDLVPKQVQANVSAFAEQMAATHGLPYYNMQTDAWSQRSLDYYFDPHHLNAAGAELIADELCQKMRVDLLRRPATP